MVVPDDGSVSRSYRITYGRVRLLIVVGLVAGIMFVGMAGSWWYLAARAARVSDLEFRLEAMGREQVRLEAVGADLAAAEEQYARLRSLLVPSLPPGDGGIWLPLSGGRASDGESGGVGVSGATIPNVWPLSEKGLITQGLLEGVEGEHPGLDIAVQTDSYIRAAGGGKVVEVGTDEVYGLFVVIDHGEGYSTVYAHTSAQMVEQGQQVREREVIALSGSSGQSTAPHLHFEIRLNGSAVDPLTMVEQPN
ncbi:MAG: M23 family metallopeptidase [Gemmatimonadetes bacterium]|nr:M23 family metallopeptidase [Gemmatimonadota bacterium]